MDAEKCQLVFDLTPQQMLVSLPEQFTHMSMNKDGSWFAWESDPDLCDDHWHLPTGACLDSFLFYQIIYTGEWQESLTLRGDHPQICSGSYRGCMRKSVNV